MFNSNVRIIACLLISSANICDAHCLQFDQQLQAFCEHLLITFDVRLVTYIFVTF